MATESELSIHMMHVFSRSVCDALQRERTAARSQGARATPENTSDGACLKCIVTLVISSKSLTFVVQIFYGMCVFYGYLQPNAYEH